MVLPVAAALGAYATSGAVSVVDNALGRPFELWTAVQQAVNAGRIRLDVQRANQRFPWDLPSVDAILKGWRCELVNPVVAAEALSARGVCPPPEMLAAMPDDMRASLTSIWGADDRFPQYYGRLWANIAYMSMSRPDAGSIAQLDARFRLGNADRALLRHGLDASWERYAAIANAQYEMPGYADLRSHWAMGRMDDANYQRWSKRVGWLNDPARTLAETISTLPTVSEVLLANYRGRISPARLRQYGLALGYVADEDWQAVELANRPAPGPADLVRFAVREVWDETVVRDLGYDEEFPQSFAAWMKWQGLDWGEALTLPDGTRIPAVSWPKAYWRAHWQTLAPTQAYQAFRVLRPDRLQRYQAIAPGVRAFTQADLEAQLKIADYPPTVRKWLAAMSYQPLDLRAVRALFMERLRDRAWVIAQMQDRGLVLEDATAWADLLERQRAKQENRAVESLERNLPRALYRETIAGYHDGLLTRDMARANLINIGLTPATADRYMQLADATFEHDRAREITRQLRTKYLQGEVAESELPRYFQSLGLTPEAGARLSLRWRLARTLSRRSATTSQLLSLVAQGAILPGVALLRLANLGWNGPDAQALVAGASARLFAAQSRQAEKVARQAKATQRERVAALRSAERASKSLRSQLRSITPLTTLRKWLLLGIRQGQWIRQRMLLLGFDTSSIDGYLSQWVMEAERNPPSAPPIVAGAEKLLRRQTSRATVGNWWKNGVVTDQWARQRLQAMGYTPESVELFVREWRNTLGKKPGPATAPVPIPAPATPASTGQSRQLETGPRSLETSPSQTGTNP